MSCWKKTKNKNERWVQDLQERRSTLFLPWEQCTLRFEESSWPTDKTRKSHLIGPANTLGFRTFRNYRFCISGSSLWAASTRLTDLGGRSVTSWFALGPAAIHTPTSNRAVLTPITNSVGRRWTVKLFLPLQACIQYIKHLRMRGFGRKQRATMHA